MFMKNYLQPQTGPGQNIFFIILIIIAFIMFLIIYFIIFLIIF